MVVGIKRQTYTLYKDKLFWSLKEKSYKISSLVLNKVQSPEETLKNSSLTNDPFLVLKKILWKPTTECLKVPEKNSMKTYVGW